MRRKHHRRYQGRFARLASRYRSLFTFALAFLPLLFAPGFNGVVHAQDPMMVDYDTDDDGLIEITALAQLDAVRHDLNGDGISSDAGMATYAAAFPDAGEGMGCSIPEGCTGYELIANLDFDTNESGDADAGDAYWNDGAGWAPIGGGGSVVSTDSNTERNPFLATFEGNGHTVANLFIDTLERFAGLFGYTGLDSDSGAAGVIRNVGLTDVNVSGELDVGGLVGHNRGVISSSYVTGRVSGGDLVGGLVGDNYGPITDSHSDMDGCVSGEDVVGGLVGRNYDAITNSYVTGCVSGKGYVGGLVGNNYGPITASYVAGRVSGRTTIGGLVGSHKGTITASYATGHVAGKVQIGGLVGDNREGAITASYATSSVAGANGWVGGLVGISSGAIAASYATGRVSGNNRVGGLVGVNSKETGVITASYARGRVSGNTSVGGLVGVNNGDVTASYWDTRTSGHPTGTHGEGRTTTALQAPMDYNGIYRIWNLDLDGIIESWNLDADSDGVADDPWAFGTATQYPVLAVDIDGNGQATWQEFGYQLREGPPLTARAGLTQVDLSWTAVDTSPWTPAPDITYTLTRDDGITVETLAEEVGDLQYADTDVTASATYTYQVAAVVTGGEATRSARVTVILGGNNSPAALGSLVDRTLRASDSAGSVEVAGAFRDSEGDALTYGATSSAPATATVSLSGTRVTITPLAEGQATVTVTATDANGSNTSATQQFTVTVLPATATDYDTDDDGLIDIRSLAQLDAIRHDLNGDGISTDEGIAAYAAAFPDQVACGGFGCVGYELRADLDFDTDGSGAADAGDTYWNDGVGWAPIGEPSNGFATTFEGNGQTVSNLIIFGGNGSGLFGATTAAGIIRNVGVIAIRVDGTNETGGLVGDNGGIITASYATGQVNGFNRVGGLAGNNRGVVSASYASACVSGKNDHVGGLVGDNGGIITASYATSRVSGNNRVGGLVGYNNLGAVTASYATARVSGHGAVGGLIGDAGSRVITASYWDTTTSGQASSDHGAGQTAAALQAPTGYSGIYAAWNLDLDRDGSYDTPWDFGTAGQYPALKANVDGQGAATWQEFGYQLRGGPTLTAAGGFESPQAVLTWTAPEVSHWTTAPSVTYTLYRDEGSSVKTIAENLSGLTYTDTEVTFGETYTYQVAAVVTGGEAARSARVPVTVVLLDTTAPTVSTIAISSNPGTDRTYAAGNEIRVTVTFSETVAVMGSPQLQIKLGGGLRAADYRGGTGTALVFAYEVVDGESDTDGVGVEADSLTGGTIRDAADNDAVLDHEGLAADSGHKVDGVKPQLAVSGGAVVNGTTLTLTYGEALDGGSRPASGDFTVAGGDHARTVTQIRVSGSAVILTLDPWAEHLEAGIQVSYTVPTGAGAHPVRDAVGNEAEALSHVAVTNKTPDTTAPAVSSLGINSNSRGDGTYAIGDEIEVTVQFSETVEVEGTPQLRLRVGSRTRTAGYDRGTGTAVLVFVYEVADGDEDSDGVSIEAGRIALNGGKIEDEAENAAERGHEALATQAGHKVDGVRPAFVSAAVDGASLTLTYGEGLDGGSRPASGDFTVEVAGARRSVTGVAISGSVVTLTLDPGVEHGDTGIRVSYTVPAGVGANPIRDEVGNQALGLSNRPVTNETPDTTAPRVMSITSEATHPTKDRFTVTILFTEEVTGLTAGEIVVINGLGSNFAGAGATYTLDIEPSTNIEDEVTVRVPADVAVDGANIGNVEGSETFAVDTRTPAVSKLEISSDPESDRIYAPGDEIQVTVTFSEPVDVERTPRLTLKVGDRSRPAGYREGTGTTELVFVYEVIEGDEDSDGVGVEADSLTGGTIRDAADNDAVLGHDGLAADSGHKVDGAGPDLAETGGAVVNTATLTLTFDEPLDGSSTPQASAFRVTGGDITRTVADVALSGSTVLLTLDPAVEHGETGIRVSYTVPTGMGTSPLQDVLGNDADRLSNVPVTNETPDTTPPTVRKVEITSNPGTDRTYAAGDEIQVTVTFNETVEVTGTPQLSLELGGGRRTATHGGGAGASVVFVYEVADGESDTDGVGVEADSLSGGTIRDEARNNAELDYDGLGADSGHKVDGVKPEVAATGGAVVNGTSLTLTYDEPLGGSSTPDAGDFTVSGGDRTRTVTRVSLSGSTVVLTLDVGAEHLEAGIRVSYTPGTNAIRDVPGNEAEGLSQEPVANDTPDTTPPVVSSLAISSNPGSDQIYAAKDVIEVTVAFNETVKVEGTPQLRLRVGTRNRPAGYLRGTDTSELVFGYEVADGDEDTDGVSVEASRLTLNGGTVKDEADNPAELAHEALATQAGHRVDGVRPAFVSAAVDGSSLTLTYGEGLDGGSRPAPGDFTVEVDGAGRSVSGVSISGSLVTLTLDPAVEHGDTGIRVSYTPGTNPIRDEVGNDSQGLSNRAVTNTTDAPNTAPEITTRGPLSVGENQALARRLQARDTDAGDEVTGWAIVGGADRGRFAITSDTGELSFREEADYESPADVASSDPVSGAEDNEYVVTVEVRSGAGARESTAEQTFLVRVTDGQEPPEVPEAPDISGETADSLEVSWTEPDNTGPTITDYDVQYRETGTGGFTDGGHDGPGLSLTLSGLKEGTDYEVQVRAGNEEGTSGWSDSGEGMTVTPLTLVMASGTDPPVSGPFTVRFIFSEVVSGFSRNDIETEQVAEQDPACRDSQGNAVPCGPVIGALQTVDDRVFSATVTPGTTGVENNYTLRLRVPADTVSSSASGQLNEEGMLEVRVAPPGVTLEMSSTGLRGSGGNGTARLSWNSPSDNAGSAIIRYEYRYQAVGEAWSEWENAAAGTRGVTVEGLINGQEYVFEVRAVNALGKGGAETVMAAPAAGGSGSGGGGGFGGGGGGGGGLLFPPEAPASLTAMPGDGAVRLEWDPPESDGGTPILRYEYRLKEIRGEFGDWTPIEDSAPDEVNASGYTVGGLLNGTVYVFELRAVNLVDEGPESEAVEVVMGLDPAYWSNFRAEDLQGGGASLEWRPFVGTPQNFRVRFGAGLRFEETELDGEGEVVGTRAGSYGYRYTSRTTGELSLDYDGGEACQLRMIFTGVGTGSYSYRCGRVLSGQGSFRFSGRNQRPEITSVDPFEVAENTTRVGQLEAVDPDEGDEVRGYGIAGGADGGLFAVVEETGELRFREAPDYEAPGDVESAEPESGAGDNEYVVVVEVSSGEGERERRGQRAIRVRVSDEEEPPEIAGAGVFEVVENRTRVGRLEAVDPDKQDEIEEYGIAGGADASLFVIEAETGDLQFREAPDYEDPSDVESAEPASGAADNEYIVVVEVRSGEGERERRGSRAIRVRVSDEEEPPEITSNGPFEVAENRTRVGQLEAVDPDEEDEVRGYGIAGGADGALFAVDEETGELMFREAPDYEKPGDVESAQPQSGAEDNEYVVVVEVRSGEGERERKGERAIRVRVSDEEEPPEAPAAPEVTPEGSDSLKVSWTEPENRGPEITDYEVRYREAGEGGYSDGGHEGTGLTVRLSGLKEGTVYEVQVRAVSEEGMSEWSEPGEGRTGMEEAETEDPADFTGEDLEGRRLTLRLEGEEGAAGIVELRFGEGNRFEQIESGGEQAATRSEGVTRLGSFAYEKTGPGRGTLTLNYDDGSSCELRLSFTESGVGRFVYDCGEGDPHEGSFRLTTGSLFVPVILSSAGRNRSFFTSELTLTNRGEREATVDYLYTAHIGEGGGRASEVLEAGRQKIRTDALTYLIGLGIPIPETGNRIGTLRVEVPLGSEVEAVVRTTTVVPDGRAGLAYLGVTEEEGFDEPVYLCGLRQNSRDRSNLAVQNMGAPGEGAITLRTTVYSGEAGDATARVLREVELEPGGFHQYSPVLGSVVNGYVKVERVEGEAPFYAYGVINDQANSDGSFVFPVTASSLEGKRGQTLPVIVETSEFRSELTVTNFSEEPRTLDFQFVSEQIKGDDKTASFSMKLEGGEQEIVPEVAEELRRQGVAGLGTTRGFYAGPVFIVAEEGDLSGIVIGARTGSKGGGGSYSVFYNAVPEGEAFSREAWVYGLQQNEENRSNLALVNTGEVDGSESVFHLEIYDGETGMLVETVVTKPIPPRRWHQINGILGSYAPETRQGYIRIEKVAGANPFLAYGVVNDGGAPGERSGDGAYLPARE